MLEVEDTGPGILPQHEESFRTNIGAELSHVGCRVEMVANLEEARQHLHRRKFHLVLLDMRMPDGNGLQLLAEIREASPATEVVLLTPYGTLEEAEQRHIRRALEECGGHRQRTAQVLGISERTLYRKLRSREVVKTR